MQNWTCFCSHLSSRLKLQLVLVCGRSAVSAKPAASLDKQTSRLPQTPLRRASGPPIGVVSIICWKFRHQRENGAFLSALGGTKCNAERTTLTRARTRNYKSESPLQKPPGSYEQARLSASLRCLVLYLDWLALLRQRPRLNCRAHNCPSRFE